MVKVLIMKSESPCIRHGANKSDHLFLFADATQIVIYLRVCLLILKLDGNNIAQRRPHGFIVPLTPISYKLSLIKGFV